MPRDDYDDRDRDERRPARRERERDRDDYDDRPRRSRNKDAETGVSILGIISLVLGIKALIASMIPCVGIAAIPVAAISLVLGIAGIVVAKKSQAPSIALPVAGTAVSGVAVCFCVVWFVVIGALFKAKDVGDKFVEEQQVRQERERDAIRNAPALGVAARDLFDAYDENSLNADAKYRGQVLEVTGTVVRVSDRGFRPVVELEGRAGETIECEFRDEDRPALAAVRPKDAVTIRGRCRGKVVHISLDGCVLVP